jgi:probable rRNA maturation factor
MDSIAFDSALDVPLPDHTEPFKQFLPAVFEQENQTFTALQFIFTNNAFISKLHADYFRDGSPTDVITFPFSAANTPIEGEIYISVEMAADQAKTYDSSYIREIYRYCIHGVLHLLGYNDGTYEERQLMRQKEDIYLSNFLQTIQE